MTKKILLGAAAALLLALPAASQAKTNIAVGVGDQSAATFAQPSFQALGLKKIRYFIPWDAAKHSSQLEAADAYVAAARAAHVSVLMHVSTNNYTLKKAHLPSTGEYSKYVGKLISRYKAKGVKEWGVFNEANHASEPTYKSPKSAASYFKIMYTKCKGCTIVALDVLDQAGVTTYMSKWSSALGSTYRKRVKVIGIHNYSDTNRKRSTGTASIIKAGHKVHSTTKFWLTETGGVVNFGRSFPYSQSRAASRITYMFSLAKKYRSSISRLYAYSYLGEERGARFDAGLVNPDGSIRPGYSAFKKGLAGFVK